MFEMHSQPANRVSHLCLQYHVSVAYIRLTMGSTVNQIFVVYLACSMLLWCLAITPWRPINPQPEYYAFNILIFLYLNSFVALMYYLFNRGSTVRYEDLESVQIRIEESLADALENNRFAHTDHLCLFEEEFKISNKNILTKKRLARKQS
ncbi:hypothetical protein DXG03_005782 [Asterophora parasitica]|uniref:Uncharacterized protein n=1 Tax=Asterophora parasitica TaxID=117018 RepID=A0A9P7G5I3_9AGAR|nr:hypothetical protein DXG03_005782 [Asterophora parasitica]